MKILCVAEKPSIAKSVAGILGGGRFSVRSSCVKYIKNYDFSFNFGGSLGQCEVTMTSVLGNFRNNIFPDEYNWGRCEPMQLFTAPLKKGYENKTSQSVAKNIATESQDADRLMIWTDCDREGESIGHQIFEVASESNRRITLENTLRAQFSHLERSHVIHAAKTPRHLDMKQVYAVQTRGELDIRSGFAFTRLLTDLLKSEIPGGLEDKTIVSYGSCQFPTLGFVVDRYIRVRRFISEPFWYLSVTTIKNRIHTLFTWTKPSMFDRMTATVLYANCMSQPRNDFGKIIAKQENPTSNYKPLPLTTVELQKIAARTYRMTAKDTLKAAEDLYTKGIISYPRTETDKFPAKMDLKSFIQRQTGHREWGQYAQSLIDGKFSPPRSGRHNDEAHPPIHPVSCHDGGGLLVKEKKIYELVVRHFLACCSDDAKGSLSKVTLQWGDEIFTTSALEVKEENYLEIYKQYRTWKSSAKKIPPFEVGEEVKLQKAELKEGKTSPPNYMTETELIALMDANGIGTDATIAEHIDKIQQREYVTSLREGSKSVLVPSELGMGIVQGFDNIEFNENISLTKPFLRKDMENELSMICSGNKTKPQVIEKLVNMYQEAYVLTKRNQQTLVREYRNVIRENG
ncbi:DNA topoisomerase 3 [Saccharomycopsis crataegensis]|uniref:DNA topoisomerase n=1 Tax=Saccharomycopsis crataegensis TaxID=43959 RepID=A0AAV5QN61_9ASCO|nr:DNA topoisomerase 3 [Saccharomycopsis crataegensis]